MLYRSHWPTEVEYAHTQTQTHIQFAHQFTNMHIRTICQCATIDEKYIRTHTHTHTISTTRRTKIPIECIRFYMTICKIYLHNGSYNFKFAFGTKNENRMQHTKMNKKQQQKFENKMKKREIRTMEKKNTYKRDIEHFVCLRCMLY